MDKRTILALVLIFIVFWLSNELIWKKNVPPQQQQSEESGRLDDETIGEKEDYNEIKQPKGLEPIEGIFGTAEEIEQNDEILLTNEKVSLYLSNRGGVIRKAYLNDYFLSDQNQKVNLLPDNSSILGIKLKTDEGIKDLSKQLFSWEKSEVEGYPAINFFISNGEEKIVQKQYVLAGNNTVQLSISAHNIGEMDGYIISFNSGITDTEKYQKYKDNDYKLITQTQGDNKSLTLRQLKRSKNGGQIIGNVNWAAVRSKYFIQALILDEQMQTSHLQGELVSYLEENELKQSPGFELHVKAGRQASVIKDSYQLYIGPLIYDNMKKFGVGLEVCMEFGWKWIQPLSRLFLWLVTRINKAVSNYGVTIIIFALILKLVLYPLTQKSFSSMQKMQKIQPRMQEIQKKYKSDPQKMQTELSKLYKEHGANPMGGCLPLLLQMPVFFSLYPVLRYSIDLRQASFILWITDLSEPDTLMILPIIMGIFMFIQQKMSAPKDTDKANMDEKQLAALQSQKMMMYVMPVFMVFVFKGLPSGLVLYWTVFNVFSIVQQYFIKKKFSND